MDLGQENIRRDKPTLEELTHSLDAVQLFVYLSGSAHAFNCEELKNSAFYVYLVDFNFVWLLLLL